MSIDVKITQNDMTGPFVAPWMITVTVQNGEHAAMQYCRLRDVVPDAKTVGKVVEDMFRGITKEN